MESNLLMVYAGTPKRGGISTETASYMGFLRLRIYINIAGIKAVVGYATGRAQAVANG